MKLHSLRRRTSVATGAAVLSIALLGAACAEGDDDAGDTAQVETTGTETDTETDTTDTETGTEAGTETDGDAGTTGEINGRVGATYASNVFALIGSDVESEGQVLVVTDDESVDVNTADTVSIDGEVTTFDDPAVEEALGEDYERFEADFSGSTVVVADSITVQE